MRALKFITGHVIFKLRYNQIYQLKTTHLLQSADWTIVKQLLGSCQAVVRQSGSGQSVVRQLSGSCQAVVGQSLGSRQAVVDNMSILL